MPGGVGAAVCAAGGQAAAGGGLADRDSGASSESLSALWGDAGAARGVWAAGAGMGVAVDIVRAGGAAKGHGLRSWG